MCYAMLFPSVTTLCRKADITLFMSMNECIVMKKVKKNVKKQKKKIIIIIIIIIIFSVFDVCLLSYSDVC